MCSAKVMGEGSAYRGGAGCRCACRTQRSEERVGWRGEPPHGCSCRRLDQVR